ncbi:hypothetical protein HUJ05_009606 [Dendroctonus ponderosae]|nr:hypothetical protein HUJ05_005180 [Dendroctonus ponderosae]KAH1002032.1 hypothetical protein HUJ05_009602 [Dendroctonus ponderosae]KAH1002035.1 hypothetical protein HUJ05_009606 [Dendroctonus ponderosae]
MGAEFMGLLPFLHKNLNLNNDLSYGTLNIGRGNVQGIRTELMEVISEIRKMDMDIIALSETKKKGSGIEEMDNYIHLFSGVPKDN